ncbi:hypothetical protein K7432_013271 [Basidiobolus ranarum]|uniref:Uncharacterized protein n=1 Tax=Basidiobolus ranarum TaxID=34480 RepID=A0ABR2VRZ0_9FUNG
MKTGDTYVCTHEDYRHINDHSLRHSDKHIFWQKIDIPADNKVITRMATLSYACCLNKRDLSDMVGEKVNVPFKAAMGVRFKIDGKDSGFVLIYSSDETWNLPEQEVELFEDIVGQIEIALQQSAQLKSETNGKSNGKFYEAKKVNENEDEEVEFRLSNLHHTTPLSLPPPPPFSYQDEEKDSETYDMKPLNWH